MARRYTLSDRSRLRERAMAGVRARERLRLERAQALRDVGGFVTDGCLGSHTVRLLTWPDGGELRLAITVDGQHRQARTFRGVLRCLATMIHVKADPARHGPKG